MGVDLDELGMALGMTLKEIKVSTAETEPDDGIDTLGSFRPWRQERQEGQGRR